MTRIKAHRAGTQQDIAEVEIVDQIQLRVFNHFLDDVAAIMHFASKDMLIAISVDIRHNKAMAGRLQRLILTPDLALRAA